MMDEKLRVGQEVRFGGKTAKVVRYGVAEGGKSATVDLQVFEADGVRPYYERNVDPGKVQSAETKAETEATKATSEARGAAKAPAKSPEARAAETPNPKAIEDAEMEGESLNTVRRTTKDKAKASSRKRPAKK